MKHKIGFNRLSRKASHRKALIRNMVSSLFVYERITTTKSKAKEVRKVAEKMITRAKIDSVHTRREVAKKLFKKSIIAKLFTEIAPRFVTRPGGYTRVIKIGQRAGDAAELVFLELVDRVEKEKKDDDKDKKDTKTNVTDKQVSEKKTAVKTTEKTTKKTDKKETKPKLKEKKDKKIVSKEKKDTTVIKKPDTKKPKAETKDATIIKEPDNKKEAAEEKKGDDKDTTIIRE